MLCEFKFSNFRSYRDETVLDMTASPMKEFSESLIVDEHDGQRFLPVSVIYGLNAGGKSNLFKALHTVNDAVGYPIFVLSPEQGASVVSGATFTNKGDPFAFDDARKSEPSDFELYFRVEDNEYRYRLSLGSDGIAAESLYRRKIGAKKPMRLFVRSGDEIELGATLARAKATTVFNREIPYLSFLRMNYRIAEIDQAAGWIYSMESIDCNDFVIESVLENSLTEENEAVVTPFLQAVDVHIDGYRVEKDRDKGVRRIWVRHKVNGKDYELPLEVESAGTQKLMRLTALLFATLAHGTLLVVDELDSGLHPMLLRYIVMLFKDPDINKHGAQIVFTAQDASIMRNDVFRRDEIWFAARNEDEASELWSLSDMHEPNGNPVNKNAAFAKQYLSGRYGADPILDKLVNWPEG